METTLALPQSDLARKLNDSVFSVIKSESLIGFEKAYLIAKAASELKTLLTAEYMKPIMALQGNRLGFKTDKDDEGGYKEDVVKNCLIEAVLTGVQPFGNQFNIIASNCYITKEGFGHLLSNIKGLSFEIVPSLPRINADRTSAAIVMKIEWTYNTVSKSRDLDIPVRMNARMGTDAVIGKATRKARAWLFNTISGIEIADGDTLDVDFKMAGGNNGKSEIMIDDLKTLYEEKRALLTDSELKDAERIIAGNESASYKKLHTILSSKS